MTGLLLASVGALGVYLVSSAALFGWGGLRLAPWRPVRRRRIAAALAGRWMHEAGLADVRPGELLALSGLLALVGGAVGLVVFGGALGAIGLAAFAGAAPVASFRTRRTARMEAANDAWPQIVEEIRVLTGAAGRSIPQALLEVGARGPDALRPAFAAAQREWLLTTDFERTVAVLMAQLGDPAVDATCETLLVAHDVGGGDLDRRLAELAEDRRLDNLGRKDARSKQAGVRFARRFVVGVPLGMAVAGMSLGDGRAAYGTATGQALVAVGLGLVAVCWVWSGRMLQLPRQGRVFA